MINYFSYFPENYKPNSSQDFILTELNKAKLAGVKYIIINAPTGCGKSLISKTLSNSIGKVSDGYKDFVYDGSIYDMDEEEAMSFPTSGTAVLTMTKTLQDQYINLFSEDKCLKGKSNYQCNKTEDLSCDIGPCTLAKKFIKCKDCPYYCARDEAVASECSFYSYAMFMSLPAACQRKKILICDEASELEDAFVQNYSIDFNFKLYKPLKLYIPPTPDSKRAKYNDYILWFNEFKNSVSETLFSLRSKLKGKKSIKREEKIKYRALKLLDEKCNRLAEVMHNTEFIIEHTEYGITFKPFKIDKIAQKLFNKSDFVVLMSATIIDHKNFAKQLGISEKEYYYIETPSLFDPKKAPIKLSDKFYVTYSNKALVINKLAQVAKQLCELHKNQKGIIHTHSMDITNEVKKVCNDSRFLIRDGGATNTFILEQHKNSDNPTVLVSPSMSHGIDLYGELGEFAIIMKAPFLPLGDKRIKRLCDEDPDWYTNKMLSTFIQMCGRTIRSELDESITYVLDATLTKKLLELGNKIPKYIRDRFI